MKPIDDKTIYYSNIVTYILAKISPVIFFALSWITIEKWFVSAIFTMIAFFACDWALNAKWPVKPNK